MDEGWEGGKCNSDVVEVMMTVDEFFRDQDPEFFYVGICFMYMLRAMNTVQIILAALLVVLSKFDSILKYPNGRYSSIRLCNVATICITVD